MFFRDKFCEIGPKVIYFTGKSMWEHIELQANARRLTPFLLDVNMRPAVGGIGHDLVKV